MTTIDKFTPKGKDPEAEKDAWDLGYMAAHQQAATATQELREEVGRLREALEWYSDLEQYEGISLGVSPLNDDRGQRAREALKEQKK